MVISHLLLQGYGRQIKNHIAYINADVIVSVGSLSTEVESISRKLLENGRRIIPLDATRTLRLENHSILDLKTRIFKAWTLETAD